jgi:hypothetical protein
VLNNGSDPLSAADGDTVSSYSADTRGANFTDPHDHGRLLRRKKRDFILSPVTGATVYGVGSRAGFLRKQATAIKKQEKNGILPEKSQHIYSNFFLRRNQGIYFFLPLRENFYTFFCR